MAKRVLSFWKEHVMPHVKAGKSVLIVAHRNPLKAILEHLSDPSEKGTYDAQVRSTLPYVLEFGACNAGSIPQVLTKYSLSSYAPQLMPSLRTAGKAVFLRHGESMCNVTEAFTGWEDSGLTAKGEKEAVEAGRNLKEEGFKFSVVFTSVLSRALESVERICRESDNSSVPIVKSWRMNARHPGVLQGLTKPEAVEKYGKEKVNLWRGSYDVMPECVALSDARHPANDPLYKGVPPDELPPGGESLAKTVGRVLPFWRDQVSPRIHAGETVLIVGHKNSLRGLFMYLEDATAHEMFDVREVSAKVPLVFEFGDSGFSSGLAVVRKYWIKSTGKDAVAKSRRKDGPS
jgi:2,3-bisphosphoglycerate-dependent phosphoglycerate mutase